MHLKKAKKKKKKKKRKQPKPFKNQCITFECEVFLQAGSIAITLRADSVFYFVVVESVTAPDNNHSN